MSAPLKSREAWSWGPLALADKRLAAMQNGAGSPSPSLHSRELARSICGLSGVS